VAADSQPEPDPTVAVLRRALEQASKQTQALQLPDELPALLVGEGVWSPAEALDRIDRPSWGLRPAALAALAPRLSADLALAAFGRIGYCGDSFDDVAGVVALARRLIHFGAAADAVAALTRLAPAPRGLALARVAAELPLDLREPAMRVALDGFSARRGNEACIAHLALARALPAHRDALVAQGLQALFDGDDGTYPYILQWMAYADARDRAVDFARRESMPYPHAQALAAVLPWCDGDERAALWTMWREACERAIADRWSLASLRLPLPARGDELVELLAQVRSRPGARERAVALAHLASHHRELLDEALAAIRQLTGLDLALGLVSLLASLDGAARHDVAREALVALARPGIEREPLHNMIDAWPWPAPEPPVAFHVYWPALRNLRTRAIAHLAPLERRTEALALLADVLRIDDAHHRAGAIAALGGRLPDASERERVLALAESVACASTKPWIGLSHVLRRVDRGARPDLARRALALLPDDPDEETVRALPPLLVALAPDEAATIVTRILERDRLPFGDVLRAACEAALQAGAVRPLADAILGGRAGRCAKFLLPQLLRHADAELRPRVVAAVLAPLDDGGAARFPDLDEIDEIARAVPWLTHAERERLAVRIPVKVSWPNDEFGREQLIVALARPLAEQGALGLLRPLLASIGQTSRLIALASALPFLDEAEREQVTHEIVTELERGNNDDLASLAAPHVAAAGHASALLELLAPFGAEALAHLGPHLPADQLPRFLELLAHAALDGPRSISSSAGLRALAPWFGELPRDAVARLFERVLEHAGDRGRSDLLQAFITDEDDPQGDGDTGLLLALAHLVSPAGLADCIAQLEDVTKQFM
jgi:hypothetical protein